MGVIQGTQGWERALASIRIQGSSSVPLQGHRSLFSTEDGQLILVCLRLFYFSTDSPMS